MKYLPAVPVMSAKSSVRNTANITSYSKWKITIKMSVHDNTLSSRYVMYGNIYCNLVPRVLSYPMYGNTSSRYTMYMDIPILNPLTADQKEVKTPSSAFLVLRVLIRGKE